MLLSMQTIRERSCAGIMPLRRCSAKVIRIVSELPKNALGKVERRALATLYPLAS
jgi:acyl-coenzyme A synthetase/AMP-(fatty) acid ligase